MNRSEDSCLLAQASTQSSLHPEGLTVEFAVGCHQVVATLRMPALPSFWTTTVTSPFI